MIADLDETIRQLLIADLPVKNGEIDISFDQPKREWSSRLSKPTANLFLYDVRENNILRQHQWEVVPGGNGRDNLAHLKRSPLRVDCFYMLTTWAAVPEDEHRLLSRCMLVLFRYPLLPRQRLVKSLVNQPFEIQARLASHDRLTNPAEVWSSLDNELRPSVSYIVTLALEPWAEISGPIVRTLLMQSGQSNTLPELRELVATTRTVMADIGGTLLDKGHDRKPLPGLQVAVKGTGLFSTSDEQGRFVLGSLSPGDYTLVAWLPDGKLREKEITIPAPDGDYDFEC